MTDQEIMDSYSPLELAAFALHGMDVEIYGYTENTLDVQHGYTIEIEPNRLYKLLKNDNVIAPFKDIVQLGEFIKNNG